MRWIRDGSGFINLDRITYAQVEDQNAVMIFFSDPFPPLPVGSPQHEGLMVTGKAAEEIIAELQARARTP